MPVALFNVLPSGIFWLVHSGIISQLILVISSIYVA